MQIPFPFIFDGQGHTADVEYDQHVRQLIEQVLFTNQSERLNRPDFGTGLIQLVHSPNSEIVAAALQSHVQSSLQQWLGDLLDVHDLAVENDDNKLIIHVSYSVRRSGQTRVDTFERSTT
jgi:uncharacterized protein